MIKHSSTALSLLILFLIATGPVTFLKADSVPLPPKNPLRLNSTPDSQSASSLNEEKIKEPEQWSPDELALAHKTCSALLSKLSLKFEPVAPIRKGKCGAPAPIKVTSIGTQKSQVLLAPYAIVNCPMIAAMDKWLNIVVQPTAKKIFNDRVTELRVVAHYACRTRYGNPNKRMSEHAYANAIDIAAVKFENKKWLSVLNGWGMTERDIQKKIKALQEKSEKEKIVIKEQTVNKSNMSTDKARTNEFGANKSSNGKIPKTDAKEKVDKPSSDTSQIKKIEKSKSKNAINKVKFERPKLDDRAVFLRQIHRKACGLFGTVLGPEANDAHKDHFHLDLAPRRRSAYCE